MKLSIIINKFMEKRVGMSPLTYREDKAILKLAQDYFGHISDWGQLHPNTLDDIFEKIAKDKSVDRRNRVKKKMQQLIDFAIRYQLVDFTNNPFHQVKLQSVPKHQKRDKKHFESSNDVPREHHTITRLYEMAKTPQQKLLILMATITGGRINEVLDLKWSDINVKNPQEPLLKMKNSKLKMNDECMDRHRLMDINPQFLEKIYEQKQLVDKRMTKLKEQYLKDRSYREYFESKETEVAHTSKSDKRADMKWQWVITTKYGDKPCYSTALMWYHKIWHDTYMKYKDHQEYPFLHGSKPQGLTFHAYRRYYANSYRDSFGENYTKAHHDGLQLRIGHKIGSQVTDDFYTDWQNSQLLKAKMNSKINLGVDF